jgi:hypothetical protein
MSTPTSSTRFFDQSVKDFMVASRRTVVAVALDEGR